MTSIAPPPRSVEFEKFIEFTLLLASPRDLKPQIEQFKKATDSFKAASKEYNDVLKIAKTVDIAETMRVANEVEATRLKVLAMSLDDERKDFDMRVVKDGEELRLFADKTKSELQKDQQAFETESKKVTIAHDHREKRLTKLEGETKEAEAALEVNRVRFESRRTKVEEAYAE